MVKSPAEKRRRPQAKKRRPHLGRVIAFLSLSHQERWTVMSDNSGSCRSPQESAIFRETRN